jgi:hypothetical protein
MESTELEMSVEKICGLPSFLSPQCAASHTLPSGPFLARMICE